MRTGKLRHRFQIQAATETRAADGDVIRTWATAATRWGGIRPLRGVELFEAQQVQAREYFEVRLRYYDGLTTHHRLREMAGNGTTVRRLLHIEAIADTDDVKREHVLTCTQAPDEE